MSKGSSFPQLLARLAIGLGFMLPVMDRFGMLGPPGSKGVAWGSWENFVSYTNTLLPFLNNTLSNVASSIATVSELVFGICLIIGFKIRFVALGSALLTLTFGICMAIFLNIYAPFGYPVFVFTAAALLLSQAEHFRWSVDMLLKKQQ